MANDYSKLKVVDLKAELKTLGLPTHGLKADLVARLEEATASASPPNEPTPEADDQEDVGADHASAADASADPNTSTNPDASEPPDADEPPSEPAQEAVSHDADEPSGAAGPVQNGSALDQQPDAPPQDATVADLPPEHEPQPEPALQPEAQPTHQTSAAAVGTTQDSQKRKRSSLSPAHQSDEDAMRKRPKQQDVDPALEPVDEANSAHQDQRSPPQDDGPEVGPDVDMANAETANPAPSGEADDDRNGSGVLDSTKQEESSSNPTAFPLSPSRDAMHVDSAAEADPEPDRHVETSLHPATTALYVKNLMRPLRPQQLRDHLLHLATPADRRGSDLDDSTISDFYVDSIKTHAFIVFKAVSDASRVRSALHQRVWPDETNRKSLWVDFMPPERFAEWVDMEQGSGGRGRGSSSRFEVVYDHDDDGNITARLEEGGAAPPPSRQPPRAQSPFERKPSIPSGPANAPSGIEGAPSGPRGGRGPPAMYPSRAGRLDEGAMTTRSYPSVSFKPVDQKLSDRRLEALSSAKARDHDRYVGTKEYKRYYFEIGDRLVDRGPEIFLAIRPPHRERERQREFGGGPPRDGGGQWRRGGGGGGGRSGRLGGSMPRYHGVPKGGDRFRPSDSFGRDDRGSRY